jgi:hypothetical protein
MHTQFVAVGHHATDELGMSRGQLSDTEKCSPYLQFTEPIKDPIRDEPNTFFLDAWVGAKILEIEGETDRPIHGSKCRHQTLNA